MAERQALTSFKLRWREGKRAPCGIIRWVDAVVDGNTVYVRNGGTGKNYSYDFTSDSWSELPDSVHPNGSLAIVNGWLTSIGGNSEPGTYVRNELFSLKEEGGDRRWTKKFPPMPTKRRRSIALCTGTTLVVAGGEGESYDVNVLSTVEVMNTGTHQWSMAADLPERTYLGSATVCGDELYILSGLNHLGVATNSMYTCSVSALLQSCVPSSLEATNLERISSENKARVWRQVVDLPVTLSTCESFHGQLMVIGGKKDSSEVPTTAVFMYNSTTNSWEIISHMTTSRWNCFTAVLPDNTLMVVGGFTEGYNVIDTVEVASVHN